MGTHVRERESHIPSRRQALRVIGFSGLAAAVPVTAVALAGEPHPDAELIRLGEEFDLLYAMWLPLWCEAGEKTQIAWDLIDAEKDQGGDVVARYFAAGKASGAFDADEAAGAVLDRMRPISEKIRSMKATTFSGLHAKARVILFESFRPVDYVDVSEEDMDWEVLCYVQFMRQIAALAGEARA